MRATTKITWLLLSLSFLFYSVCSNDESQSATSVSKNENSVTSAPTNGSKSRTEPTISSKPNTGGITATTRLENESTQRPTAAKTTAAITTPAPTVTATPKPAVKTDTTQPQALTVTNNPGAPPTSITDATPAVVNDATPAAATTTLPKTIMPVVTADSSGSLVVSPNAATIQTTRASVPTKTSGTEAPTRPPGNTANVGTTKIPHVSTDALTTGKQSMTHTTVTSKPSQEDSKEGTKSITVTVTSREQTTSRATEPAGNTGTTSNPSTLTKTGPSAARTLSTKAGTTYLQTTPTTIPSTTTTTTAAQPKTFSYSLNKGHEKEEEKELVEVCKRLMVNLQDGNCTLTWRHHNGKIQFDCVKINGKVKTSLATQYYEEITKKPTDNKTLIAILASCGALLIMIVILAVCASHHRKPYNENQQHLTEELHTVENGYHDNPTLEVMEVQPEMQEKKMALNGEFNDSWIVPIDNLLKEDIPDEEDTHL